MSWLLHRVDDRLLHGQVVVAWAGQLRPSRIWVADDRSAADPWQRELLASAAPGIEVRVVPVATAATAWADEAAARDRAFLVVGSLKAALALVEAGAAVPLFNLGGLHHAPGKTRVNDYIFLDDEDRRCARALLERGVALEVQDVPATRPQPLLTLDPQAGSPQGV
jgi:mannose/fructose/N-acetylgalactosamine-specific phosphotransferase system component IIB